MAIVKDLESHVVQDVLIAQKVHPVSFRNNSRFEFFVQRIIGGRGSGVRALMKKFGVEIKVKSGFCVLESNFSSLHAHQPSLTRSA